MYNQSNLSKAVEPCRLDLCRVVFSPLRPINTVQWVDGDRRGDARHVRFQNMANGGLDVDTYMSRLTRLDNVGVTVQNPDAPSDFDESTLKSNLCVGDCVQQQHDRARAVTEL